MTGTIKARALAVVDSDGKYGILGFTDADWGDCISVADGLNGGPENQFWLEVDLPVPAAPEDIPTISVEAAPHALNIDPEEQGAPTHSMKGEG